MHTSRRDKLALNDHQLPVEEKVVRLFQGWWSATSVIGEKEITMKVKSYLIYKWVENEEFLCSFLYLKAGFFILDLKFILLK